MIPKTAKRLDHTHLAEGEVTGHYHAATAADAVLYSDGDSLLLDAPSGTDVTHQEHGRIALPPGQYDRLIVREIDPFSDEIREVRD